MSKTLLNNNASHDKNIAAENLDIKHKLGNLKIRTSTNYLINLFPAIQNNLNTSRRSGIGHKSFLSTIAVSTSE